jgi:hypothetical protein
MKLNKIKMISLLVIGSSVLGFSALANAEDLKVTNNAAFDVSFSINNACSPEFGDVAKQSVKVISDEDFKKACAYQSSNCEAKIFNAPSCGGEQIGTAAFDASFGVKELTTTGQNVTLVGSGFNLEIKNSQQAS